MAQTQSQVRRKSDIRAIFVHAGAGFHSIGNERLHLKACEDACKAAMAILKAGGTAVDAVEIAVKVLEDREITNAGYGSNLAIDGVVECDAVVVDQFGRSGAVGAVAQIKNPVSLARLILDRTTKPLLLRRVPPNLLCGEGATQWAHEQGMEILPFDGLISPAAQDRWKKWKEDLDLAERKYRKRYGPLFAPTAMPASDRARAIHRQKMTLSRNQQTVVSPSTTKDSDCETSSPDALSTSSLSSRTTPDLSLNSSPEHNANTSIPKYPAAQASHNPFINSTQKVPTLYNVSDKPTGMERFGFSKRAEDHEVEMGDTDDQIPEEWTRRPPGGFHWHDGSSGGEEDDSSSSTLPLPSLTPSPPNELSDETVEPNSKTDGIAPGSGDAASSDTCFPMHFGTTSQSSVSDQTLPILQGNGQQGTSNFPKSPAVEKPDLITDTVGAVAIDAWGNIAAAASSGGIGMKHQGRIGPAALVGVGASVIPVQEGDPDNMCIATVTSGTGEHMATTMAAQTCSERMYHGMKKGGQMLYVSDSAQGSGCENIAQTPSKGLGLADHDDDVVCNFIEKDFMNHPSVKNSISVGAIGVLTVKKTKDGAFMYFAHNTDSFALASMHGSEDKPVCCMSRSPGNGAIAQGGRAMRFKRKR